MYNSMSFLNVKELVITYLQVDKELYLNSDSAIVDSFVECMKRDIKEENDAHNSSFPETPQVC